MVVSQSQEDYDSDESLMNSEPVFLNKKRAAETPNSLTLSAIVTDLQSVQTEKAKPNSPSQLTPYASHERLKSPTQMQPHTSRSDDDAPFQFPALLSNGTLYRDLRHEYILSFWQTARGCTRHSHDGKKLDQLVRKVVLLALTPFPIRSLDEYCFSQGVGGCAGGSKSNKAMRQTDVCSLLHQGGFETREMLPAPVDEVGLSLSNSCGTKGY